MGDQVSAGDGDDIIDITSSANQKGANIDGGMGNNTLKMETSGISDIASIINVQTLDTNNFASINLTATELNEFQTIKQGSMTSSGTICARSAGIYDFRNKTIIGTLGFD
jgi:hypothetical protein